MSSRYNRNRRKKSALIRSLLATAVTTSMITTGGFGIFPENNLTEVFQQTFVEFAPPEINQFFSPYYYDSIDWELPTLGDSFTSQIINEFENFIQTETIETRVVFPLALPIGSEGRNTIDATERYGKPQSSQVVQHGVDFINSAGTPVLAAASGNVVFSGKDDQAEYGPYAEFHGLVVILEHNLTGFDQPVFTVYSHLSEIQVELEQFVNIGDQIGLVGSTGDTSGSELHFEVRLGDNLYGSTRNPELWLAQFSEDVVQQGALAGRILDQDEMPIIVEQVVLQYFGDAEQDPYYLKIYADENLLLQPPWNETFALGNLSPGEYKISVILPGVGLYNKVVEIKSGRVTEWEWVAGSEE
ncbi:MAG: M23 family metallopeptidase [Anaerolineales bacterium]|nr:M23 family metallopeptidase [Chloroflexota bacterium]MBL6983720.1 M23 family metallopeptidase [Anaerolineales bacterium]